MEVLCLVQQLILRVHVIGRTDFQVITVHVPNVPDLRPYQTLPKSFSPSLSEPTRPYRTQPGGARKIYLGVCMRLTGFFKGIVGPGGIS